MIRIIFDYILELFSITTYYIRIAKNNKTFYYEHLSGNIYKVYYANCINGKLIDMNEYPEANLVRISKDSFEDAKKYGWLSSPTKVADYLRKGI